MKKVLILLVALLGIVQFSQAQNERYGVGLKAGFPSGVSLKLYQGKSNAWDFTAGRFAGSTYRGYQTEFGYNLAVTYQWRNQFATQGLEWYYGVGANLGTGNYIRYNNRPDSRTTARIGALGVVGMEYHIPSTPIALLGELSPYVELVPVPLAIGLNAAVGIRFKF